jgi:UDP-galactopyranose mutase
MKYDYIVVGAGLFGSIFAYEANKAGKKVLVLEKRSHIGGNCYTEPYEDYHIHKYGPHVFHTSNKKVWDYINRFTDFNNFTLRCKANVKGKIYSLPINLMTIYQIWPEVNTPEFAKIKIANEIVLNNNPQNFEEYCLSKVGKTLYEMFFYGYTKKQWGKEPKDLPASLAKRLPIRFDMNDRYYPDHDIYEGVPVNGYTAIFEKMLEGIEIFYETDFLKDKEFWESESHKIVYSGQIDSYFNYCFGDLEYRSLSHKDYQMSVDFQGTAQINYPQQNIPWTRIIQHRHFGLGKSKKEWVTFEQPEDYQRGKEPFYPINDERNNDLYKLYKNLANEKPNLIIGGRLGNYKYYDMDMTIANALSTVEKELAGKQDIQL